VSWASVDVPDGIDAVFTSDLGRAVETARIAFEGSLTPILCDWRLRECDYGNRNGAPADEVHRDHHSHLDEPYPGGESWRQAVRRVGRFLDDLHLRWEGSRTLVIGHIATRWALDHFLNGVPLEDLIEADFAWREGWEYRLDLRRAEMGLEMPYRREGDNRLTCRCSRPPSAD